MCERPICRECEEESGDRLLCAPCKQALSPVEDERVQTPSEPPESRSALFMPGEVTVFDDGTVVSPEPGAVATTDVPPGPAALPNFPEEEKPSMAPLDRTGPLSQIFYALPYGLGAGVLVAGVWLLIALFSKQWTQVSIFSLGLVVPWALFNSTTRKKRRGRRVWMEPPPVWMVSAVSFAIVAVLTLLLELLAYKVVYGSNPARLPFSDFVRRYMKSADWFLVACGLALALLVPFILKIGAGWSKPSLGRKRGAEPPRVEDEKGEPAADTADAERPQGAHVEGDVSSDDNADGSDGPP